MIRSELNCRSALKKHAMNPGLTSVLLVMLVLSIVSCGDPGQSSSSEGSSAAVAHPEVTPPTYADVEYVVFTKEGETWKITVTVRHEDLGWDHYADSWRIIDEQGNELARRVLRHPHVNEQPFSRSLEVSIPPANGIVFVEAHCLVDGYGGRRLRIDLHGSSGPGFEIRR